MRCLLVSNRVSSFILMSSSKDLRYAVYVVCLVVCKQNRTKVEVIRNQHLLYKQNLTVAFPSNSSFTSQVNPNISYKMVDRNTLNDSVR